MSKKDNRTRKKTLLSAIPDDIKPLGRSTHIQNGSRTDSNGTKQLTLITDFYPKADASISRTASPVPPSKSKSSRLTRSRMAIMESPPHSRTPEREDQSPVKGHQRHSDSIDWDDDYHTVYKNLPIYIPDAQKHGTLSLLSSPTGTTAPPRRLANAKLLNQLTKSTASLTMETIAKHYLSSPLISPDEMNEIKLSRNSNIPLSPKLESMTFLASYTDEAISKVSKNSKLQGNIKELLETQKIDLRCDRTFPIQHDMNLFQSAIKHSEKVIRERKRSQDLQESLWLEGMKKEKIQKKSTEIKKEPQLHAPMAVQRRSTLSSIMSDIKNYFLPRQMSMDQSAVSYIPYKKKSASDSSHDEDDYVFKRKNSFRKRNRVTSDEEGIIDIEGGSDTESSYPMRKTPSIVSPNMSMTMSDRLRPRSVILNLSDDSRDGTMSIATATTIRSVDLTLRLEEEAKSKHHRNQQPLKIKKIIMGDKMIRTWYNSPYPAEYINVGDTMYICIFCLKYATDPETHNRHKRNCKMTHPPGQEIYRDQTGFSVFEIDGYKHKIYCQNLCLLAKLFLDHKILYYDVNSFMFYVLAEYDTAIGGHRFIGYFSKERNSDVSNNVSCIVILPGNQNKGYGHFLIDFSYLLTRAEGKVGGPETPLSDLGFAAYSKYWSEVVVHEFQQINPYDPPSFTDLAKKTGIFANHLITSLEWMECWVKTKDGQFVVNFEKISRMPDMLPARRRPNPLFLKWDRMVESFKSMIHNQ